MNNKSALIIAAVATVFAGNAFAVATAEEAKALGNTLTPWGAEKAGNKEGTIPAYTGEPIKVPASYDRSKPGQHTDPFGGEKPLFTITAQNYTQYASKLDGMADMFKKFPNYRMDVYTTHRNTVFPKYVLDNSIKNATSCRGEAGGQRLEGCYAGLPFPIPKVGIEVMWNHLLGFQARSVNGLIENFVTPTSGDPVLQVRTLVSLYYPFYDPSRTTPWPSDISYYKVRVADQAPARQAGGGTILVDPLDYTTGGRRAWQYIPGQRRVKLAPDLAYDTPSPYSGGSNTMDDQDVFLGAMDRFDFKLVGKKEKYIPYNNFALSDFKTCPNKVVYANKNFPLPSCVRWELHRVWVVEATLKPQLRHIYKRRMFYFDEDATATGLAENYDASGALYRVLIGYWVPFYEAPGGVGGAISFFNTDLQSGVVGTGGLGACEQSNCGYTSTADRPSDYFSPEAMAGDGVR